MPWYAFLCYAAAVAICVRALTDEEVFREPRDWLKGYCGNPNKPCLLRKAAYMPTCEFCCSFWISLALVTGLFRYHMLLDDWRGYVVGLFVTMGTANVYLGLFGLLRVDLKKERAVAERAERRKSA